MANGFSKAAIARFVASTLDQFETYTRLSYHSNELKKRLTAKFPDVAFGGVMLDFTVSPTGWWLMAGPKGGRLEPVTPSDMAA